MPQERKRRIEDAKKESTGLYNGFGAAYEHGFWNISLCKR